jgi:hypothetical protein
MGAIRAKKPSWREADDRAGCGKKMLPKVVAWQQIGWDRL